VFLALERVRAGIDPALLYKKPRLTEHVHQLKRQDIISLLKMFSKRYGDTMPDGMVRLPFRNKIDIYRVIVKYFALKYVKEGGLVRVSPPSYSYFMEVWADACKDIRLARDKGENDQVYIHIIVFIIITTLLFVRYDVRTYYVISLVLKRNALNMRLLRGLYCCVVERQHFRVRA
jgi:hypothetical protein